MHPVFIFIAAAILLPMVNLKLWRQLIIIIAPLFAFISLFIISSSTGSSAGWNFQFLDYNVNWGRMDKLSLGFGYIFTLISLIGFIYALHVHDHIQHVAAFTHIAGALGVVFAGDLLTLWIFWEVMALGGVFLVWSSRTPAGLRAGFRYVFIHLIGGALLLAGILLHIHQTGSSEFGILSGNGLSSHLIMLGFLINAAVPPFSAWLSDAYPESTITGSVILTAFTTKSAVYVLIRGFPGLELLAWLGVIMTIYGVIYAILENDIRRLLAYHIISQVGYMVCGIGLGSSMALNGATAHAFCHILYKALLFMGVGAVIHATGRRKLSELQNQGLASLMPLGLILYMIGAFSISGVPLFNGFISKSITISAAAAQSEPIIELLLILASIGTFISIGLKLPYFTWFGRSPGTNKDHMAITVAKLPKNMYWAMGLAGGLCILLGCAPGILYQILPYPLNYHPYTADHIISALQLLVMTGVGFWLILKYIKIKPTITIDTDWFYKMGAKNIVWLAQKPLSNARAKWQALVAIVIKHLILFGKNPLRLKQILLKAPRQDAQIPDYETDSSKTAIGWSILAGLILLFFYVTIQMYFSSIM